MLMEVEDFDRECVFQIEKDNQVKILDPFL